MAGDQKAIKNNPDKNKSVDIKNMLDVVGEDRSTMGDMLGTILRETDCVYFSKLSSIRAAYGRAFVGNNDLIYEILSDSAHDILAGVRNCIVHRSGKADSEYKEKKATFPDMPDIGEDGRIIIDGKKTCALIAKSVELSLKLIKAVDSYVFRYETEKA